MLKTRLLPALGLLALLVACSSGRQGRTATSPAPGAAGRTASPPTNSLILSEFHDTYTLLYAVSTDDPANRRPLARIDHAPGWAPRASVAPAGDLIAYTVLPPGAVSPDTDATLWVINLREKQPRRIADRVDARIAPVWSPDGARVVVQRVIAGRGGVQTSLELIDVRDGRSTAITDGTDQARFFPVAFSAADRILFVRFDRDGAVLNEVVLGSRAARRVVRLADGVARDFRLSPDGARLLYLALQGEPPRYHALAADLRGGGVQPVLGGIERTEDAGVAWRSGAVALPTVGMVTGDRDDTGRLVLDGDPPRTLAASPRGFDAPVSWSPDGRLLYARAFSGPSTDNPGVEQPVLVDAEGARRALSGNGPLEFVGWVAHAP